MSNFWNKDGLIVDVIKNSNGIKYITEDDVKSGVGHTVGEQWISFDGTIPEGGLPFDGQLRNIELYQQLFDWAKENGRVIDEEEWQVIRETNNDNVPYYSAGDGSMGKKAEGYIIYPISSEGTYNLKIGQNLESWPISNSGTIDELVDYINSGSFGENLSASYVTEMYVPETTGVEEEVIKLIITSTVMSSNDNLLKIGSVDGTYYEKKDFSGGKAPSESTTFRLPIFNSYFKADGVGGGYIAEGLPNITGTVGAIAGAASVGVNTGAFAHGGTTSVDITNGGDNDYKASFDASRCSAIYGNSEHVTPETSTVIVGVWAVGSYTNLTNIDMSEIKEAINVVSTYDSMPLLMSHWDTKGFVSAGWVRADGYWLDGNLYRAAYDKILQLETIVHSHYVTTLDTSNPFNFLVDTTNVKFRLPFLKEGNKVVIKELGTFADNLHKTIFFGDGTIEINGLHTCTTDKATITWETPVNTDYKLFLTDTDKNSTGGDTDGYTAYAAPAAYSETSFYVSLYKSASRVVQWVLEGTPVNPIVPETSFLYFKLGNTFINEDQMDANYLATKVDTIYNSWQEADYVVDSYSNGTEWYRLYKSGWLEQGGEVYHNVKEIHTVNLLLPYRDTYYNVTKTLGVDGIYTDTASTQNVTVYNYTTTTFSTRSSNVTGLNRFRWKACGYSDNLN